jgi:hypothetical protein
VTGRRVVARAVRARRDERGSSILEVVSVLLLVMIVMGAVFQGMVSATQATEGSGARLRNLDEARVLMATTSKDLRTAVRLSAGTSPFVTANKNEAIFYANLDTTGAPKRVRIHVDSQNRLIEQVWEHDPASTAPNYTYTTTTPKLRMVGRYVANDSAHPIFTYVDANDVALGPLPLSASNRLAIKAVRIELIVYRTSAFNDNATTVVNRVRLPNVDYNAVAG